MEFRRHITFCRNYTDDSGMPEWPRGSRRAVCYRFDSFVTECDFVMHMMHNPAEFQPYFDASPLHVRHVITAPTGQGTGPHDAIQFSRWVASDHADNASIRSEWRNDDVGAMTRSLTVDGAFRICATFPVHDDASIANLCRWILERRFNGFQHKDALILFSAYAVPPHPDDAPATNAHRGTLYQPHPLARPISNPFSIAAANAEHNNAVVRPASPAGTVVGSSSGSEPSEDEAEGEEEIPEAEEDDDNEVEGEEEIPEADPDPEPIESFVDNNDDDNNGAAQQADPFPQQALRRISDELFDVRQEMPEAVYVRLSNSLKRRLGE